MSEHLETANVETANGLAFYCTTLPRLRLATLAARTTRNMSSTPDEIRLPEVFGDSHISGEAPRCGCERGQGAGKRKVTVMAELIKRPAGAPLKLLSVSRHEVWLIQCSPRVH